MTAAVTKDGITVKVGQVWMDLDKRMLNRKLQVVAVSDSVHAIVSVIGAQPYRTTRIKVARMHKKLDRLRARVGAGRMKAARMGAGAVKAAPAVTGWFVGVKPVRAGWYDTMYHGSSTPGERKYFDGAQWRAAPCGFVSSFGNTRAWPGDKWRGLAADPAKAGK